MMKRRVPSASGADSFFAALYAELRRIAARELSRQTAAGLGATTVVHEAYLILADRAIAGFPDRARFMAYACRVMRGLIVDDVRNRLTQKRGGGLHHTTLVAESMEGGQEPPWIERISDALDELATHDPALAELVDLKFFGGFSFAEIAVMRGVSERTVFRSWRRGRAYLHRAMAGDCSSSAPSSHPPAIAARPR